MNARYWVGLTLLVGACATVVSTRDTETIDTRAVIPEVAKRAELPPAPVAPALPETPWTMESIGARAPEFPLLPGESADESRSIGTTADGYLVNAVQVPVNHERLRFLEIQSERGLVYTSTEMLELVTKAADFVWQSVPQTPTYLGNFGAEGGGDIPYSVSHNSGRDADFAFHMLAPSGNIWVPKSFVEFADDGTWVDAQTGGVYRFDVVRNWALVEGLIRHHEGRIQTIFVSNGLRRLLLEHAASTGVSPSIRSMAATLLTQPGGALPHNDHFHLRLYCSERDVASGCEDTGRRHAHFRNFGSVRSKTIAAARQAAEHEDPEVRKNALWRLMILNDRGSMALFRKALKDPSEQVRIKAIRALVDLGLGDSVLIAHLEQEKSPRVRLELITGIGLSGQKLGLESLVGVIENGALYDFGYLVDERAVAADALTHTAEPRVVPAMISVLSKLDRNVIPRVRRSLNYLTNHDFEDAEEWQEWLRVHGKDDREAWLISGFQSAGFRVEELGPRGVWELCRAISDADHLSVNAQQALMRIASNEVPSLTWSKYDASFYWRRWFERRSREMGLPPIPPELSTAGGYVREEGG